MDRLDLIVGDHPGQGLGEPRLDGRRLVTDHRTRAAFTSRAAPHLGHRDNVLRALPRRKGQRRIRSEGEPLPGQRHREPSILDERAFRRTVPEHRIGVVEMDQPDTGSQLRGPLDEPGHGVDHPRMRYR
jgi:hypothetical protein